MYVYPIDIYLINVLRFLKSQLTALGITTVRTLYRVSNDYYPISCYILYVLIGQGLKDTL